MSGPVVFAVPAAIELVPDPIRPHWILEGTPQARSRRLAQSADGTAMVMAWSCTAGRFNWYYTVDETVHVISGEVFVTDEKGDVRRLGPGDMAFFPAGSRSIWHVPNEVRKLAVCHHGMPRPFGIVLRAWNKACDIVSRFSIGRSRRSRPGISTKGSRLAST
ncbi:MAG TPA: cupin domain-containing protein [Xanthobacteraceae bacterium]|nr:cupin domain-containing protein [Xanthobacteraceae bacterium]